MTKHQIFLTTLVSTILLQSSLPSSALAKENKLKATAGSKGSQTQSVLRYSQAEAASPSQEYKVQVGLSTISNLPNMYPDLSAKGGTSITGLIELSKTDSIQAFFTIPTTSAFNIDALGMYKKTIIDDGTYGLHVGAGFGLGIYNDGGAILLGQSNSNLVLNFVGVAGIHFEVPGAPHLKIHLDGGPSISIINSSPSQTSFHLGGLSPALGLSVLYAI
ncbi:hypothetical protein EBS43_11375 [bacterium]|nr:hypothetical protein [bacterium]